MIDAYCRSAFQKTIMATSLYVYWTFAAPSFTKQLSFYIELERVVHAVIVGQSDRLNRGSSFKLFKLGPVLVKV